MHRYISQKIKNLASEVAIHNIYCPTADKTSPLPYMTIPLPSRGFKAVHTLQLWQKARKSCYFEDDGSERISPVPVCFWTTDAAAPSLSAGKFMMTPNADLIQKGVTYIGLDQLDEKYQTPYFWKYPFVYFPDPDHLLRLFLRSLKYNTRCLTFYKSGDITCMASIDHLEKLRHMACKDKTIKLSLQDLILIKYHDQNTNAAEKVFSEEICTKLQEHVGESNGTVLYIKAVCSLLRPCRESTLTYKEAMVSVTTGLYILRLWKKYLEISSLRLHSMNNTSQDPSRRGCFITMACYDCAELIYSGVVGYFLTMFIHFPDKLKLNRFPLKIGTTSTERIISEIQGQTTYNQYLDKQPTYAAMLHRMRGVEENQLVLEDLKTMGVRERISNKRREVLRSFTDEKMEESNMPLPHSLMDFIAELKLCHMKGVKQAQAIVENLLPPEFVRKLKQHNDGEPESAWDRPYTFKHPPTVVQTDDHPFVEIDFLSLGHNELENIEKNLVSEAGIDVTEGIEVFNEQPAISEASEDYESNMAAGINEGNNEEEYKDNTSKWYFSKLENGVLNKYHIMKIIKSIIPREYISRERSKRHIKSVALPGLEPVPRDHDVLLFHDYIYKDYKNAINIVNVVRIEDSAGDRKKSCSSQSPCKFLGRMYEYFDSTASDQLYFTKWIPVQKILAEIEIERKEDGLHEISESSQQNLEGKGITFGLFGLYLDIKSKKLVKTRKEDEYYEIENVKSVRYNQKFHHFECLVKFKGYGDDENTWLPESSLKAPIRIKLQRKSGRISNVTLGGKDTGESTKLLVQDEPVVLNDDSHTVPDGVTMTMEKRKIETADEQPSKKIKLEQCYVPLRRCTSNNTVSTTSTNHTGYNESKCSANLPK